MGRIADEDPGLQTYLTKIERYQILDRNEELELAERYQRTHDIVHAHALVNANLRFVVRIALGYRGYGMRVADLVEEGNLGLLEAVRRFEPARNLRFMTYASYWVRAYILSHILKQRTLVGVGTGPLQFLLNKILYGVVLVALLVDLLLHRWPMHRYLSNPSRSQASETSRLARQRFL